MTFILFKPRLPRWSESLNLLLLPLVLLQPAVAESRQFESRAADEQLVSESPTPRGTTPAAPTEITRSKRIADNAAPIRQARSNARNLRRAARALSQLSPVQTLYVQRHIEDKNDSRQSRKADVFYYDYSKNQSIQVTTDLDTNTVLETRVSKGVGNQPFFSSTEIKAATQLVLDHPVLGSRLRTLYQEISGQPLNNISQLTVQGGIFFPASMEQAPLGAVTAGCAEDRCMQLFVSVDDKGFIDVSNLVVDLSRGEVLWVEEGLTGHRHSH